MIPKQHTFLVVDDFETMRKTIANHLRSLGAVNVLSAPDGAEALKILKTKHVDFVLSDWNMPVMTGIELLKAVRADEKLCHLPFVMITAEAMREQIEEAANSGISDLILKPYTMDRLSEKINKALDPKNRPAIRKTGTDSSSQVKSTEPIVPRSTEVGRSSILVVDDTPDNLHLLAGLFKDEYQVRVANSGEKALEIIQSEKQPDLVLLDIMMPGMDGFEVARRMREHPNSEHIPVIFVTAMIANDARLKGLELGAVDFVTKPIDPDVLKPRVRNFMRYVELHKRLQADYDTMLENVHLRENVEHITRHDLKSPLAGIIGLVQALAVDESTTHKQVEQLRLVEETALQTLNMINLSSELYKIETGRYKLNAQPVKISEILHRIVEIARNTYSAKQLTLVIDTDVNVVGAPPPESLGDAMFCYSLFQNLLKNACEAAPDKSSIVVAVIDDNPLRITLQNKGAVPGEIREHFFDKFVTQGKTGGTGLGTYSAKLLTEAQNGSISMEASDKENLTTITVSLPRALKTSADILLNQKRSL